MITAQTLVKRINRMFLRSMAVALGFDDKKAWASAPDILAKHIVETAPSATEDQRAEFNGHLDRAKIPISEMEELFGQPEKEMPKKGRPKKVGAPQEAQLEQIIYPTQPTVDITDSTRIDALGKAMDDLFKRMDTLEKGLLFLINKMELAPYKVNNLSDLE